MILNKDLYKKHGFIKGLYLSLKLSLVTLIKLLIFRPSEKVEYPFERYPYSDRFRGKPYLTVKDDGTLRCTACMLCVEYCPSKCIHIEALPGDGSQVENATEKERKVVSFDLEILRCIFCGLCEEACPVDAIRLSGEYEMSGHAESPWLLDHYNLAYRSDLNNGKGITSKVK